MKVYIVNGNVEQISCFKFLLKFYKQFTEIKIVKYILKDLLFFSQGIPSRITKIELFTNKITINHVIKMFNGQRNSSIVE